MKRVLFIINSLGLGGAERVVVSLANQMAKEGNKVYIIYFKNQCMFEVDSKVKTICLYSSLSKNPFNIIRNKMSLEKIIKSLEEEGCFDLITAHLFYSHLICRLSIYSNRVNYVMHSMYSKMFNKNKFYLTLFNFMYKSRNLICVSQGLRNEFIKYWKIDEAKSILVINNPIDIDYIMKKANEEVPLKDKYIVSAGRLTKIKQFDVLIIAYLLSSLKKDYKLLIIGEGEDRERLEEIIHRFNGENYVFLRGYEKNPYKWIKNAAAYVCTSSYECFPLAFLESLCCNTPVVSFNCDYGPREILRGELKKYLVKNHHIDDLIETIERAVLEPHEIPEEYFMNYDVEKIVELYFKVQEITRQVGDK
ncbi:glycosyltransferase [Clostridium omnivorum]|uniref:Glycosyl transferase n=1 Tax=Clostridium omnivorum TaxID=1604902 RepID=A0ABQ5N8A1_9CLOT|nr:glycosyltransferase [Clostridium sp. E14]GLC31366.1 glycosyl transferase [Clostridium sp. E14]